MVLDPLALKIVSGELKEKDNIIVDLQNNEIVFRTLGDLVKTASREKLLV
jgi:hypothetical protein